MLVPRDAATAAQVLHDALPRARDDLGDVLVGERRGLVEGRRAYMSARGIQAGVTLYAQAFGRDRALPPPFRTGLSDAIRFTTAP